MRKTRVIALLMAVWAAVWMAACMAAPPSLWRADAGAQAETSGGGEAEASGGALVGEPSAAPVSTPSTEPSTAPLANPSATPSTSPSAPIAATLTAALVHAAAQAVSDLAAVPVPARVARELSARCAFEAPGKHSPFGRLTDGGYRQPFLSADGALDISVPEGEAIFALTLCFATETGAFVLQKWENGAWTTFLRQQSPYAHVTVALPGLPRVRVATPDGSPLLLNEVRAFASGPLPEDVQQWRPTPEKADLMLIVGHPDDEFLFFGGLIPLYAAQGKHVLVAYMTCQDSTRRAELLNGLWAAGVREYPVLAGFVDRSTRTLEAMYDAWTREAVDSFFTRLLRQYRPDVLVTHGMDGEYGHGAHRVCADAALRAFDRSADPLYMPQHSQRYGVWQVKKLYLHQYPQNPLHMDWTLDAGGESAMERARRAFFQHASQAHFHMQFGPKSRYDCAAFGLAKTTVGPDVKKDDFFENTP